MKRYVSGAASCCGVGEVCKVGGARGSRANTLTPTFSRLLLIVLLVANVPYISIMLVAAKTDLKVGTGRKEKNVRECACSPIELPTNSPKSGDKEHVGAYLSRFSLALVLGCLLAYRDGSLWQHCRLGEEVPKRSRFRRIFRTVAERQQPVECAVNKLCGSPDRRSSTRAPCGETGKDV